MGKNLCLPDRMLRGRWIERARIGWIGHQRAIPERPDAGPIRNLHKFVGHYTSSLRRARQRGDKGRGRNAGRPDEIVRGDFRAVIERNFMTVVPRDAPLELYFNAALGEFLLCVTAERLERRPAVFAGPSHSLGRTLVINEHLMYL